MLQDAPDFQLFTDNNCINPVVNLKIVIVNPRTWLMCFIICNLCVTNMNMID